MSRGLSKNQRRILGIAYSVNQITHAGGYDSIPDVSWKLIAHKIYRVPFTRYCQQSRKSNCVSIYAGGVVDTMDGTTKSAKTGSIRAISCLVKSGLLQRAAPKDMFGRWQHTAYDLTDEGRAAAAAYVEPVSDYLIMRSGLFNTPDDSGDTFVKFCEIIKRDRISLKEFVEFCKESFEKRNAGSRYQLHIMNHIKDEFTERFGV